MFEIWGRLFPTKMPISSFVRLCFSLRFLYARASSIELSWLLWIFSTRPRTAASLLLTSLITQGTNFKPASFEALSLLSPAISSYWLFQVF